MFTHSQFCYLSFMHRLRLSWTPTWKWYPNINKVDIEHPLEYVLYFLTCCVRESWGEKNLTMECSFLQKLWWNKYQTSWLKWKFNGTISCLFWQWLLFHDIWQSWNQSSIPSPFDLVKMQVTLTTLDLHNQLCFRNLI